MSSNDKKLKDETGSWNFNNLSIDKPTKSKNVASKVHLSDTNLELRLEESNQVSPRKTRTSLANELKEQIPSEDIYELAPFTKRFLAYGIDVIVIFLATFVVKAITAILLIFINIFISRYLEKFSVPDKLIYSIVHNCVAFIVLSLIVVLPVSALSASIGKKILGLEVRGIDQYSISFFNAFLREFILKPISLLLIIGIFMPFFTKKRQSLHDYLIKTVVVEA